MYACIFTSGEQENKFLLNKPEIVSALLNRSQRCVSLNVNYSLSGADPEFQVRGVALKKIAPSGGRRENCWAISCEKSRFYAKKSYFFSILGEGGRRVWIRPWLYALLGI